MVTPVELEKKLQVLKVRFEDSLPERFEKIQRGFTDWSTDIENVNALQNLHIEVHGLCGTAPTFGYTDLGQEARTVENYLRALIDGENEANDQQIEELQAMLNRLVNRYL